MSFSKKYLRLFFCALFSAAAVFFCSVTVYAADGSNGNGASLPDYNSGTEINVLDYGADATGSEDSASAIQDALNVGKDEASDTHKVVVYIPDGTYNISKTLKIYSNTQLILSDGATILKCFQSGCMLKTTMYDSSGGGYDGNRNILIQGGTWDGNTANYSSVYSFSNIRIAHANNIYFSGVTILNNKNGHHLELGGVRNVTIDGCSFSGYTGAIKKEAIQLDVMNCDELFTDFAPFDDTPCDSVIIENCTFSGLSRGLGSHSAVAGIYYTNITIKNNVFENISDVCMILYNYKKCSITGNTISDCGAGITFNYMSDEDFTHFFTPTAGLSSAKDNITSNADTIIEGNDITVSKTSGISKPYGIKLYGADESATSAYPAANYMINNVRIKDNTISSAYNCLLMYDVYNSSVRDNTVSPISDGASGADLISISDCYCVSFSSNTIQDSLKCGMRIDSSSDIKLTGNSFSGNSSVSLVVNSSMKTVVSQNVITGGGSGIKLTGNSSASNCSSNVIKNFSSYGIDVSVSENSSTVKIKSNDFSGGGTGINCKSGVSTLESNSFEACSQKIFASSADNISLGKPTSFSASEITENQVKLTWNYLGEASGINLYRKSSISDEYVLLASLESGSVYTDENLVSGVNYVYKLAACLDLDGEIIEAAASGEIAAMTKQNIESSYVDCPSEVRFTSRPVTPEFSVTAFSRKLIPGVDYTYEYKNNIYVGTAQLLIYGKGNYTGTLSYSFEITLTGDIAQQTYADKTVKSVFSTLPGNTKYYVELSDNDVSLLISDDETLSPIDIALNSLKLRRSYILSVSSAIWSSSNGVYYYNPFKIQ